MVEEESERSPDDSPPPATPEDAFAEFVASRGEAGAPDFERWVGRYPKFETELRRLGSEWRSFDSLFRRAVAPRPAGPSHFHLRIASSPDRVDFVEFTPDRELGDFRLVRRIGQGGMGEVWEAEQHSLQRRVALKFIRPDCVSERAEIYFDREARAGGRLNHPGLVSVHATGEDGGLRWIVQELVPGSCTLKGFLTSMREEAALPARYFERVAGLTIEVCDAIQVAHEANVIHRDLKPNNILIAPDDHPKVTDFGLARLLDEPALSGSYALKGTPVYMSPEQAAGKTKLIDHRTDVYSLGSVLYELITLHRPFEGETGSVLNRIQNEDPADPRELRPEVPGELAAIALKALEKRPADRYATMRAFADDLRRYLNHEPVLARPPGPLRRAQKWALRHPTAASVAALVALTAVVALVLGRQVREAQARSTINEKQTLLTRAWRKIDVGDLDGASAEIDDFNERFPHDSQGHLVLAAGFARSFRVTEMESELGAIGAGEDWEDDRANGESAMGLCLQALRLLATEKGAAYGRIRDKLERALELDPGLEVALFPLYQVCKAQGDLPSARQALAAYRGTLRTSDPNVRLVDAMLAELDGDLESARATLEDLRTAQGDEAFGELRGFRALGRVLVQSYLDRQGAEPQQLQEGVDCLQRATTEVPSDYSSFALLGKARLLQYDRTPQRAEKRRLLDEAERSAQASLTLSPGDTQGANQVLAGVALKRLLLDFDPDDPPPPEAFENVRALLDEVEREAPGAPLVDTAEAELRYREGTILLARNDEDGARERFAASLERNPDHLEARIFLGEVQYMRDGFEAALETFRAAEQVWTRRSEGYSRLFAGGGRWCGRWIFTVHVWAMGAADRAGELGVALEYDRKVREDLDVNLEIEPTEVLTLVEFLSKPAHDELRDCAFAARLIEQYQLRERLGEVYGGLLDELEQACR